MKISRHSQIELFFIHLESLQDGGWTGMIVCISPTERDVNETVSLNEVVYY